MRLSPVLWLALSFLGISAVGCTVQRVPSGSSITFNVVEGGLVESVAFAGGPPLNVQITGQDDPEDEFLYPYVLTIGHFSPVLGSGFTNRTHIYFESGIGAYGHDLFPVEQVSYQISWQQLEGFPVTDSSAAVFSVTLRQKSAAP